MKLVKYVCEDCGHGCKYSKKELFFKQLSKFFLALFVMFGLLFILFVSVVGVKSVSTSFVDGFYTFSALHDHDIVRGLAVNITRSCDGDSFVCLARELFLNMSGVRYVPDSLLRDVTYSPLVVYEFGDDCEGLSQMFVSFASSVGVPSSVRCSDNHCVARVFLDGDDVIVDLTGPVAYSIGDDEVFTDYSVEDKLNNVVWR